MATILITHGIPREGFSLLAGHRMLMPDPLAAYSEEELCQMIPQADAVVAGGRLSASMIRRGAKLKLIANYGAGYDGVDIQEATRLHIPVTNIPDVVTYDTAELAIGLMLSVSRRIGEMSLRARLETPENLFGMGRHMGRSLRGQTLGIIGAGRIGLQTADLAHALGMRVLGYSRHGADSARCLPVSMEELLAQSDVVSLHCPLTKETRHLMDASAFARMKPGAMLINTSRGAVLDTDALCNALISGHLAGAGLDVYEDEPHIPQQLRNMPCVVLTPHIGTNTEQTRRQMAIACSQQILDVLAGKIPRNVVNGWMAH